MRVEAPAIGSFPSRDLLLTDDSNLPGREEENHLENTRDKTETNIPKKRGKKMKIKVT